MSLLPWWVYVRWPVKAWRTHRVLKLMKRDPLAYQRAKRTLRRLVENLGDEYE